MPYAIKKSPSQAEAVSLIGTLFIIIPDYRRSEKGPDIIIISLSAFIFIAVIRPRRVGSAIQPTVLPYLQLR